jgi:integrase/recombinase XerD
MPTEDDTAPTVLPPTVLENVSQAVSTVAALADIPEEDIWLAKQKSKRTRRAYRQDVRHFMRTLTIRSYAELRQVDHRAVIAWERIMREIEEAAPSTVRRRLAALSSLFKHLKHHHHVESNPVADVERPAINRREGSTLAFSRADAARLLNTPAEDTIEGLRDRAILSVGLQVGLRRAEIAALTGEDLHQNRGFESLRIVRKGGRRDALAIHPNVAQRIRAYLDAIDRVLRKHAAAIGLMRGYSAHSMRATFITTALENGCSLEDVQRAAGHSEPGTTKLYDRRAYNPEKSASFFATY